MEMKNKTPQSYNVRNYVLVIAIVWTMILAISSFYEYYSSKHEMIEAARIRAVEAYKRDILYRRWNSKHGGVYVKVGEYAQPNPYLSEIKDRDIVTTTGIRLTLMNPAYMSRQVFDLAKDEYGMRAHLTSLKLLNPENKADEWETAALKSFEASGDIEISSIETMDGVEYMRLMRPLHIQKVCLDCHSSQGYKLGDIRGGISVSVPMAPHWSAWKKNAWTGIIIYFVIWIIGLTGIVFAEIRLDWSEKERHRIEDERERLVKELTESLENIKTLSGLVPICATCKKIRDDKGFWNQVERYVADHSRAEFTHSICPQCAQKLVEDAKNEE